jgi:hypothetical protein
MLVRELIALLNELEQDMEVEIAMNGEYQAGIEANEVREVMESDDDGFNRHYVLIGD